jgi:hypothetical protein
MVSALKLRAVLHRRRKAARRRKDRERDGYLSALIVQLDSGQNSPGEVLLMLQQWKYKRRNVRPPKPKLKGGL